MVMFGHKIPKIRFWSIIGALVLFGLVALVAGARADSLIDRVKGRILLQVQEHGEAWYVNPVDSKRYYLGRPSDAFRIMREKGVGITNADLAKIPQFGTTGGGDMALRQRLKGRILLQVQSHGEAWYVYPNNLQRYYLGRPADAFQIMRNLGLGISNQDLTRITRAETLLSPLAIVPAPRPIKDGCAYNNPACRANQDCVNNQCVENALIRAYITCPTQEEKEQIERDFNLSFAVVSDRDYPNYWGDIPYQCDPSIFTTTDPTRVKTYNIIRFLKNIQFSRSLPFTDGASIYDFLISQRIKIRPHLHCHVLSAGFSLDIRLGGVFSRWYPVVSGTESCEHSTGVLSNMLINDFIFHPLYSADVFVHEAWHAKFGRLHTGAHGGDATIEEMGSWAIQFYFNAWVALYSTNVDENTKRLARDSAAGILQGYFSEGNCPSDNILREVVNQIVPNSC